MQRGCLSAPRNSVRTRRAATQMYMQLRLFARAVIVPPLGHSVTSSLDYSLGWFVSLTNPLGEYSTCFDLEFEWNENFIKNKNKKIKNEVGLFLKIKNK